MPLQTSWVYHLFAKLTVRYGQAFTRQYADADPTMVKADWAEVLDGTSGEALSYALRYLPNNPPNAMQFRDLCRAAPTQDAPKLPPPVTRPDPARVRAALERMRQRLPPSSPAQQCIDNIERIVAELNGIISEAQRHMVAHCLRMPGTSTRLAIERAGQSVEDEAAP
jgi:hypothetical protein